VKKIADKMYKNFVILVIFLTLFSSQLYSEENAIQDSLKNKSLNRIKQQDYIQKDIFGNPISEKEIKDFNEKDREEQKEEAESYIFGIGLIIFASPIYLPIKLLEDDYSETFYFQKYPFEKGDGFTEFTGRNFMGNIFLSTQYVNKDIIGYHTNSTFSFLRLSVETRYSYYQVNNDSNKENLSNLDAIVTFVFAQNQFTNFSSGFGYNHFANTSLKDGLKWVYKVHLFQKPFNLNLDYGLLSYDLASGKNIKFNNEFNIDFGIFVKRVEFKLGYRWNKIGEEKLYGPEISTAIWL